MKKAIAALIACLMILVTANAALASDESWREHYEFTGLAYGNIVDYAKIEGYTVYRGTNGPDKCVYAMPDGGGWRILLFAGDPVGFVPCGDKVAYFGPGANGKEGWQIQRPGQKPVELPVNRKDTVFYGDYDTVWYTHVSSNGSTRLYSMGHDGKGEKLEYTIYEQLVAKMYNGSILTVDFEYNNIYSYFGSERTHLYHAQEALTNVSTTGSLIFAHFRNGFGIVHDNSIYYYPQPGTVRTFAFTGLETIMLIAEDEYGVRNVVVAADSYDRFIYLGAVPYVEDPLFEIGETELIVYNGERFRRFETAAKDVEIDHYGLYDQGDYGDGGGWDEWDEWDEIEDLENEGEGGGGREFNWD